MKFNIEIDATPAEARAFLGLPDLTPLHDMWIEQMRKFAFEGLGADDWGKLVQSWTSSIPMMSQGFESWQKMMQAATR